MAQYYTDFSEYTVDSTPADFTKRWFAGGYTSVEVKSEAGVTGGKYLEVVKAARDAALLSWDEIDADPDTDDIEILVRWRA